MKALPRVSAPLLRRWREVRFRWLPWLVFASLLTTIAYLWIYFVPWISSSDVEHDPSAQPGQFYTSTNSAVDPNPRDAAVAGSNHHFR